MRKRSPFDQVSQLPPSPGVYLIHDVSGAPIYIGKAKNLRRRLSQYKNAKRRKKHAKMRAIVAEAARIDYRMLPTDLEACILETQLIQQHRPKWNVAGAFCFLYPMVGTDYRDGIMRFCYTTQPETFPDFRFHGSYRSRQLTKDAFFALMDLLEFVGHRIRKPSRQGSGKQRSYVVAFRQLPQSGQAEWDRFWKGESKTAAEQLVLALVENAGARAAAPDIQEKLNELKRFWRHEALPLQRALGATEWTSYPVSQKDRDILFLKFRGRVKARDLADPAPSGHASTITLPLS